jgi:hypothetical protein
MNEFNFVLAHLLATKKLNRQQLSEQLLKERELHHGISLALSKSAITRIAHGGQYRFSNNREAKLLLAKILMRLGSIENESAFDEFIELLKKDTDLSDRAMKIAMPRFKSKSIAEGAIFVGDPLKLDQFLGAYFCYTIEADDLGKANITGFRDFDLEIFREATQKMRVFFRTGSKRSHSSAAQGLVMYMNNRLYLFGNGPDRCFYFELAPVKKGLFVGLQTFDWVHGSTKEMVARKVIVSSTRMPDQDVLMWLKSGNGTKGFRLKVETDWQS